MHYDKTHLAKRIEETMLAYVATRTNTNSPMERNVEDFFTSWFESVPYFKNHPQLRGLFAIPGDHLGRTVPWCLLKGQGAQTIVLIHHHDCVETVEFGNLEHLSLRPHALVEAYRQGLMELPPDAAADLATGDWLFGRGVSDMKGGGSIQLCLLEHYSQNPDFKGNLLLISVPDEENLSAGMRGAVLLLQQLREQHGLDYQLMLNSEPHEREADSVPTLYDGSVGKLLPMVYVRGKLAHVGQVFKGLNPINLLSEIVRRTELNPFFMDQAGNTVSPPATWLYAKDRKLVYDVSLPMGASGCLSVLPLVKTPMEIMDRLKELCQQAFEQVLADMNASYRSFAQASGLEEGALPWQPQVLTYGQLYDLALRDSGPAFEAAYQTQLAQLREGFFSARISMIEAGNLLIEKTLEHIRDTAPMVIIGLVPPYYPSANNAMLSDAAAQRSAALTADLLAFGKKLTGQDFFVKNYFTGISDLSYAMFAADPDNIAYIEANMLMWKDVYDIPLEVIRTLSMPVLNIGPWGKDLHKITERVYLPDLYGTTPSLIDFAIQRLLGN